MRPSRRHGGTFPRWAAALSLAVTAAVAGPTLAAQAAEPAGGVRDIAWRDAVVPLPAIGACPAAPVSFTGGTAETPGHVYRFAPGHEVAFADVTADGVEDALLMIDCGPRNSEYSGSLVAVTVDEEGRPSLLGTVADGPHWMLRPTDFAVEDGDVVVTMTDWSTETTWVDRYRWSARLGHFELVG
ncbi:hypothetical protein [Actinoalloteichus caeruleus]|uniref:hypothetical protein n=1 Tax=Actinoalloteichus cyanogriseus TaxID=2893586 RepID=UPI003AAF994C